MIKKVSALGKVQVPCYYRIYALLGTKFIKSYHCQEGFFYLFNEIDEKLWLEKQQVIE